KPIALLGVENLAVVDTGDVILITKLDRAGDVKQIVAALKARGRDDLI
ncbi:MAG: mannose-1-phosphate guanylyltransferase, partial [Deltaproteobacteria bacterium]|nr:mannose-1-phosphate guanylyltransferase [Deltaproteobacteria bacterium]